MTLRNRKANARKKTKTPPPPGFSRLLLVQMNQTNEDGQPKKASWIAPTTSFRKDSSRARGPVRSRAAKSRIGTFAKTPKKNLSLVAFLKQLPIQDNEDNFDLQPFSLDIEEGSKQGNPVESKKPIDVIPVDGADRHDPHETQHFDPMLLDIDKQTLPSLQNPASPHGIRFGSHGRYGAKRRRRTATSQDTTAEPTDTSAVLPTHKYARERKKRTPYGLNPTFHINILPDNGTNGNQPDRKHVRFTAAENHVKTSLTSDEKVFAPQIIASQSSADWADSSRQAFTPELIPNSTPDSTPRLPVFVVPEFLDRLKQDQVAYCSLSEIKRLFDQ